MTFGEYVRHRRLADGLTLTEVADRVGISKQMLSHVERNINAPLQPKWWYAIEATIPSVVFDELKRRYAVTCKHCGGMGKVIPDVIDGT